MILVDEPAGRRPGSGLLRDKFAELVGPPDERGCWNWLGFKNRYGYGQFYVPSIRRQPVAHRIALMIRGIDLQPTDVVMHLCDNPSCVNPDHLRIGTHAANIADMVSKGRQARGETSGTATLTETVVCELRRQYASGREFCDLRAEFGITKAAIYAAVTGKTWGHIADPAPVPLRRKKAPWKPAFRIRY